MHILVQYFFFFYLLVSYYSGFCIFGLLIFKFFAHFGALVFRFLPFAEMSDYDVLLRSILFYYYLSFILIKSCSVHNTAFFTLFICRFYCFYELFLQVESSLFLFVCVFWCFFLFLKQKSACKCEYLCLNPDSFCTWAAPVFPVLLLECRPVFCVGCLSSWLCSVCV